MVHHFILLQLNPFGLKIDREGWGFENSVLSCIFICQQRVLNTFPSLAIYIPMSQLDSQTTPSSEWR